MASPQSVEFFFRFLNSKHQALIKSSRELLIKLVGEDIEQKRKVAAATKNIAEELLVALPASDIPSWLSAEISFLQAFVAGNWSTQNFIEHFLPVKDELERHKWEFSEESESALNFDAIFEKHKKESRLGDLFDEIIGILENIQATGAVDSVYMMRCLGKVIATMKKSKDGSYFSLNSAWEFLLAFLNNYIWGELANVPVLGSAFEALRKTIDEANEEMFKVHSAVQEEMISVVGAEIRQGGTTPSFPFVSYDKAGKISAPTNMALLNCNA